jgi:hypothetical protein
MIHFRADVCNISGFFSDSEKTLQCTQVVRWRDFDQTLHRWCVGGILEHEYDCDGDGFRDVTCDNIDGKNTSAWLKSIRNVFLLK